jgi:hypothetical protein
MMSRIGPTLETTYALQLNNPDTGGWNFVSQAEYTDPADCEEQVERMYGGAFARPGMYRVIKIERSVLS